MPVNVKKIEHQLKQLVAANADARVLEFDSGIKLYYFSSVVTVNKLIESILAPCPSAWDDCADYIASVMHPVHSDFDLVSSLNEGIVIAIVKNKVYATSAAANKETRSVEEALRESAYEGPLSGFVENVDTNLNLVRQFYPRAELSVTEFRLGTVGYYKTFLIYDREFADPKLINTITNRLNNITTPMVQSLTELQQLLEKEQYLCPRLLTTERYDRTAKELSQGKIVILLHGAPKALIAPCTFNQFIASADNYYLLPIASAFLLLLRYMALISATILPGLYVALSAYNTEIMRVQIALSIAASRAGVPYPSFVEVLIMLLMMEFLVEASLRLPKSIGQAGTTVGGIILGQAATQANLVSNVMIIIVAAVAISNFVIPTNSMNLAVRVSKYIVLCLAAVAGLTGLFVGCLTLMYYLFSLHSLGKPFFNPVGSVELGHLKSFFRKGQT